MRKSMGGVAIDEQNRVLDAAGRVIPGLYGQPSLRCMMCHQADECGA
jgi:predicted oxidoreductase